MRYYAIRFKGHDGEKLIALTAFKQRLINKAKSINNNSYTKKQLRKLIEQLYMTA